MRVLLLPCAALAPGHQGNEHRNRKAHVPVQPTEKMGDLVTQGTKLLEGGHTWNGKEQKIQVIAPSVGPTAAIRPATCGHGIGPRFFAAATSAWQHSKSIQRHVMVQQVLEGGPLALVVACAAARSSLLTRPEMHKIFVRKMHCEARDCVQGVIHVKLKQSLSGLCRGHVARIQVSLDLIPPRVLDRAL